MAGKKGKSGLPKGKTNNPNGRPKGSKNKVPSPVKELMEDFVADNFDKFVTDFERIKNPLDRAKLFTELWKKITPNPVNQEELDAISGSESPLMAKLFLSKNKENQE